MGQTPCNTVSIGQAPCNTVSESGDIVCVCHAAPAKSPFGATATADCLLIRASIDGDTTAIREALAVGADINAQLPILMRVEDEDADSVLADEISHMHPTGPIARSLTPLMYASDGGHVEAVELLLKFDARLDVHDPEGMQALHFAAQSGSVACFRALIEAGADPLTKDNFDCNALNYVPLTQISCGPVTVKQEWLAFLKDDGGLSLAGAPGARVAMAEEIDLQAVALPVGAAKAGAAVFHRVL